MMGRVSVPSSSRLLSVLCLAVLALGAEGARGATCTVTSTADSGAGTLRNCLSGLTAGTAVDTNGVTITATGTITLATALPTIANGVTITGPNANKLTIDGGGALQPLTVNGAGIAVSITGLTFANGKASGNGGAILLTAGTLTVSNSAFSGNSSGGSGGAIANAGGTLTVTGSTFTQNTATSAGGAIYSAANTLTAANNTFYGNSAGTNGGAIEAAGATNNITNNTFDGNSATTSGAAIHVTANNALAANNNVFVSNSDPSGAIVNAGTGTASASNNIYYSNSGGDCSGCTSSNAVDATSNPLSLSLGYYGGATETYLPQPGSKAICAGSATLATNASLTLDQRGFAINPSYNPCSSGLIDAGAVQTNYIQVQSSNDNSGGSCPGASCRLRTAISTANGNGYGDIDFASGVTSITVGSTLDLSGTTGINIIGSGANKLTVNGGGSSSNFSVFTVDANVPAVFYGLTISSGNTTSSNGGGIINSGSLTLLDSAVSGNTAGGNGGGIYSSGALSVVGSTISGNTAATGGGIDANSGTLVIEESTVSGNTVSNGSNPANGGGIESNSTLTVVNSTIAGNTASGTSTNDGGGIDVAGGPASVANSIVSGNTVGGSGSNSSIGGTFTDKGGNAIGGGTDATNTLSNGTGAAITLSSLALNGPSATVQTQVPLPGGTNGNPAICAGTSANLPSGITTDERGQPNTNTTYTGFSTSSPCVDAGAVQTNYTMSFTTQPPATVTVDGGFGAAVTLDESGQAFSAGSVNIPLTLSSGTLYGTTSVATNSSGMATYSGLNATAGSNLTLDASLSLTASLSLSATSSQFNVNQAATSVTVTASGSNPSSAVVADSLGFVATISPQNPAVPFDQTNGTVTFSDTTTNTVLCFQQAIAVTSGVASSTCSTTALDAQTHKISAIYNGDANYLATASNKVTQASITVGPAATSVVVTGSTGSTFGSALTFNAAVTPLDSFVPFSSSGTVTFSDGGNQITCASSSFTPSTGIATCSTSSLGVGSHTISAVYNGDSNYSATLSGAITTLTGVSVAKATPTGSLACSSNDSSSPACLSTIALNSTETFTETVTGPSGATSPTGKVTFTDNGNTISGCGGSSGVSLSSGSAQCSTKLGSGSHSVVATYNGDGNYTTVENTESVSVGQTATTTAVTSSTGGTSTVNQLVTFTVTIGPANANPALSGTVTVIDTSNSNATLCAGTVDGTTQQFSCPTQALALGTHKIEATYTNDTSYGNSTSSLLTQQVNAGTATMPSFSSSSNPAVVGSTVTFTATIAVPPGPTSPSGYVHFTADGTTIAGCNQVTLTLSSPGATTGTAACSTSTLASSTTPHTIVATYAGDSNFTFDGLNNTLSQTVSSAATTTTIAAAPSTTTVNVPVTYTVAVTAPTTTYPLTGYVRVSDNGTVICDQLTLTQGSGSVTGTNQSCTESTLTAGVHTITATYYNDINNGTSNGSTTVPVQAGGSSVTVSSSLNPSVVPNPNNVNDTVTFTAMVTTTGTVSVPLSGTVSFTANGLTVPNCLAVPVNTGGLAQCTATALVAGADTILAVYSNDQNYTGSSGYLMSGNQITPQMVQDYSLVVSSTPPVEVSQGYTTSSDLFSPQTISVVPLSVQGFATATGSPLALTCPTPTALYSPVSSPTAPKCVLASTSLAVNGAGAQGAVGIVVDATSASAGIYSVQVNGVDPTTGLIRSGSFTVIVRAASNPLTVVSGATTGNTGGLTFMLPGGVTVSNLACQSVSGPNLTGSVSPASLGITCAFNPTTITNSTTAMAAEQITVTVGTGGTASTSTAALATHTNLWLAGLMGLPIFGLMGLIRGRKSRESVFFRLMVILVMCMVAFQAVGCGGSFNTQTTGTGGGKTPPGVYKVLVAGTGSDGQTYQAVLQLNVQL